MIDTICGTLARADEMQREIRALMPDVIADLRAKTADFAGPPREAGYTIQNATGDEAVVRIYDEIWEFGINAIDLSAELDNITAPTIRVEINSRGGNVFDGIAIYNALRTHPSKIVTRVDGLAGSIASVIAQAGDSRVMVDSSQMMIHNAFALAAGNQKDHEQVAAILAHQDGIISAIYAARSEHDAEHFLNLMAAETWLTAEAAVAEGLADEILDPAEKQPQDKLAHKIASAASAVEDAVTSAEQVGAARAEAGKTLTTVTLDGLGGLRDSLARIEGLLPPTGSPEVDPELAEMRDAALKRSAAYLRPLPTG